MLRYDRNNVPQLFCAGDRVLTLLPEPGSSFQARFVGPYEAEKMLSPTGYVFSTPKHKHATLPY